LKLNFARIGGGTLLNWTSGTLQESDTVNGQYGNVTGGISPYPVPAGVKQKFYRLIQ
jgi:hypothetical protein